MSLHIIKNPEPKIKRPTFLVDTKLDEDLDEHSLLSTLNKSHFCSFISKPQGGKTSMIVGLLNSKPPNGFKGIFDKIYLVMGKNSRDSIKGSFFDTKLNPERIFDELNFDNLNSIYENIKEDSTNGMRSLLILDDIQAQLKDPEVSKLLLHMSANRRHIKLNIWIALQNYITCPKQVRMLFTSIFLFNVSKKELENINEEHLELDKDIFKEVVKMCFKKPHDFMYINTELNKLYCNWDEIIIED